MTFGLSEEELDIQARARTLMDEIIPWEIHAELHEGELPEGQTEKHMARAHELGFNAINIPKEHGGDGYTMLQQVLIQEQTGRATNALGWVIHSPMGWFWQVATPFQMEKWGRPAYACENRECYAITEEGAGSDVDGIQATARRDGDEYVLNGVKWHVTSANLSEFVFFQAKLTEGPHAGEHAMFVMDLDTPGISVRRVPAYTHTYAHHHWEMEFSDVRVPATHLIGDEGDGMTFAHEWFRYERLMIAARCCGAMERLVEEATAFAKERHAYGKPIMDYQMVQAMLADSANDLWASRLMTYECARTIDAGIDVKVQHAQCSMVKLFASEAAGRVADRAVQIFGGRGFMRENVAERFYRELRVDRIWEGTSEIQRVIIADQLAKRGVRTLTG
jgi:alkylation response protein AidB-like acyl-CoA dehydrogenase